MFRAGGQRLCAANRGNLSYHGIDLNTVTEGHIDQVKDGVAALLGAIFFKNLVVKTLRGMGAAVAAGRIAGGRSYGYESKKLYDKDGVRIRGYLEIATAKGRRRAPHLRRFRERSFVGPDHQVFE